MTHFASAHYASAHHGHSHYGGVIDAVVETHLPYLLAQVSIYPAIAAKLEMEPGLYGVRIVTQTAIDAGIVTEPALAALPKFDRALSAGVEIDADLNAKLMVGANA